MNPEFLRSELEKLKAQGFQEELVLLRHVDGAYSLLTTIEGGKGSLIRCVDVVATIVASMCKGLAAPGAERSLHKLMLIMVEGELESLKPVFKIKSQPTVEPNLEQYFKNPDQDHPGQ